MTQITRASTRRAVSRAPIAATTAAACLRWRASCGVGNSACRNDRHISHSTRASTSRVANSAAITAATAAACLTPQTCSRVGKSACIYDKAYRHQLVSSVKPCMLWLMRAFVLSAVAEALWVLSLMRVQLVSRVTPQRQSATQDDRGSPEVTPCHLPHKTTQQALCKRLPQLL